MNQFKFSQNLVQKLTGFCLGCFKCKNVTEISLKATLIKLIMVVKYLYHSAPLYQAATTLSKTTFSIMTRIKTCV
jgi:hypothetical protein